MKLQPNPPRLITVAVALALGVVGFILAWPVDAIISALGPVSGTLANVGVILDRQLGFFCLFLSPSLLVIGSLLPGIQMGRSNFAPTRRTIIVALVLMVLGLLGTFGTLLPDAVGIVAFVAAIIALLLGMVFRGI